MKRKIKLKRVGKHPMEFPFLYPTKFVKLQDVPWKAFFKSKAVWAMIYVHFCGSWGHYTCLSWLPTYFRYLF